MRTTTTTYEVKSSVTLVYSSSSRWSSILAKLSKGTQIEVISISNNWAYFIYNGKDAYIKCSSIKKVETSILGTITIKYINLDTEEEISESSIYSNLELKSYTYEAKSIDGYTLSDESTKTITLTKDNPNQSITFYYKKDIIYGTITIKYLNADTKEPIIDDEVYNNLELGDYTYTAKDITNYTLSSSQSVTVNLTENNTTDTIIFEYKEILGQVTIKYLDIDTNTELTNNDIYDNLPLGTYSYEAKAIDNYNLNSNTTQSVTLTETDPDQTIIFEYKLETVTLKCVDINPNEVPYISTYYIKPIVAPDEEVIIDYYITDYYHKEYVNEDYSEIFTVTVRIEGKDDIIIENLQAGDHSVSLGTFPNLDGQEQKFSILCTDKCGRNSHELFNFFLVRNEVPVNEYIMTEEDLTTYSISNTNDTTMITSTREGLQKLLDNKQTDGYNRLKLLEGIYRIDDLGTIYIPTNFTLDLNKSTIKLHDTTTSTSTMIELNNTFDSHVINGIIEGSLDNYTYNSSTNVSDHIHGISIGGECKYSSFENLTIQYVNGYGAINGINLSRDNKLGYTYLSPKAIGDTFKLGDIDRNTGLDIESTNRTTCDFMDISGYSNIGYLSVSVYLGYQGNPCGTWNLICHFYDENKNFIKSTDAYQFRRIEVPLKSKFIRITILNKDYPTNLSIQLFRVPIHCYLKNLTINKCTAIGIAPQAMNNMLFENCKIYDCGYKLAKSGLDAEDGWDMMQDATFRKLNFVNNPHTNFLACGGHNFIIEDTINGKFSFLARANSYVVKNNITLKDLEFTNGGRLKTGYVRFFNNIVNGNAIINSKEDFLWYLVIKDCEIYGRTESSLNTGKFLNCKIGPNLVIGTYKFNSIGQSNYTNCYIYGRSGQYHTGGVFNSCTIENITGSFQKDFYMYNCTISNCNLSVIGIKSIYTHVFKNCILSNFSLRFDYWLSGVDSLFENCTINNINYLLKLPHYSMNKPITLINNTFTSNTTSGMIIFYDDRLGGYDGNLVTQDILKLESNTINISNSKYVITGIDKNTVNNINIIAINNIIEPDNVLLCNPEAKLSNTISIIES